MTDLAIVWLRHDLRVTDNPALAAAARHDRVLPVFVLDEETDGIRPLGGAARWWLHHSLDALGTALGRLGTPLVLRRGPAAAVLGALVAEAGAAAVYWNRLYEPATVARDSAIKTALLARGVAVESFNAGLLHEPWTIRNQAGQPYKVFSQFWRACLAAGEPPQPLPAPARLNGPRTRLRGNALDDWHLLPTRPDWAGGLRAEWTPGEAGARHRLEAFLAGPVRPYKTERNRPDLPGTSRLSPHLRWGEISPREVWHTTRAAGGSGPGPTHFLSELGWREFSFSLLFHFPDLPRAPLRPEFARFPWADDPAALRAWQRGRTGYPIVDAGMRELWATGWMHNRVRMIVASFLVKDLLVPWQHGEAWFWDTLVDADAANNAASWQWVAGSGADAAPYFRIFNPVLQGEKFDPAGDYVRRWVPELARLPADWIHKPWAAPGAVLAQAGVTPGRDYPAPIVDHGAARARALAAFAELKQVA